LTDSTGILGAPEIEASGAKDSMAEIVNHFDMATCSAEMLATLGVPRRKPIIGDWFMEGDLGFIYGERGLGKT
jgi:hypothetical protein